MIQNELHNEELNHPTEHHDRNLERHQALNLNEYEQSIATRDQNSTITQIAHVMYYTVGMLELLLAVRVILYLLGADPTSPFAGFIYGLSYPFVALFANLVPNPVVGTTGIFEINTLIAMLVWTILWLIARVCLLLLSHSRSIQFFS